MGNKSFKLHVKQSIDQTRLTNMLEMVKSYVDSPETLDANKSTEFDAQLRWVNFKSYTAINDINSRALSPTGHSRHFQRDLKITGLSYLITATKLEQPSRD